MENAISIGYRTQRRILFGYKLQTVCSRNQSKLIKSDMQPVNNEKGPLYLKTDSI